MVRYILQPEKENKMKKRFLLLIAALALGASQMIAAGAEAPQDPAAQEAVSQMEQSTAEANATESNVTEANATEAAKMEAEKANPTEGGAPTTKEP
jgi:uncharacterized low-complexity protein